MHTEGKLKGHLISVAMKTRDMNTDEGRKIDFPYTLVDKWPERVLEYDWLCPVREEHKERARRILDGDDPNDPLGSTLTSPLSVLTRRGLT